MRRWISIAAVVAVSCSQPADDDPNNDQSDNNDGEDVIVIVDDDMGGGEASDMDTPTPDSGGDDAGSDCSTTGCDEPQVCNAATGECVDCLTDNECGENGSCAPDKFVCECDEGFHDCDGECVDDTSVDHCGMSCDACPTDPNGTASCDGTACALECADGFVLDGDSCVECVSNDDCTDPAASLCDAGTCAPCAAAADCSHIADATICSAAAVCVECSAGDDAACGGNSCDPATGTCTTTPKESVDACEQCVADSECMPDHGCVPMDFDGMARAESFCLPVDANGCDGLYGNSVMRTSTSGVMGSYCTINEALQTCEALADYNESCGDDSECGAAGLDDGLCEPIDFEIGARCTVGCMATAECPMETVTGCGLGGDYCGSF